MSRPKKDIKVQRINGTDRLRVIFIEHPDWVFNTDFTDELMAERWAKRNKADLFERRASEDLSFERAGRGFFDVGSPWCIDQADSGRTRVDQIMTAYRGILENHLLPTLGTKNITTMLGKDIKEAVKGLISQMTGEPLARATKNRCIWVLKLMFDYWISQGIVKTNPTDSITKYSDKPESPRGALPREIRALLFPLAYPELLKVWGSPMWAAFFGMMNDTGARNGEPRSLKWGDLDLEKEFIPLMKAIEAGKVATVKGTKNGKEKPGWPSPATIQAFREWHALTKFPAPDDWVFTYRKNVPVSNAAVAKAFRVALERLDLGGNGWTPYWLRHTFVTYGQETLSDEELRLLAGDANRINGYKHPDATALYRKGASAKKKLDEARNGTEGTAAARKA